MSTFSISPFKSYEMLIAKKWTGEPVNVYMSEVRKLAKSAGIEGDTLLLRVFVSGMPADISKELRAISNVESVGLPVVL